MSEATPIGVPRWLRSIIVLALIYLFLVGVSSLESGIKVMGADTQERLFSSVSNPIAGLFVGLLGTVLVQSSSASTSVIVGLVASGALGFDQAVPMIMGPILAPPSPTRWFRSATCANRTNSAGRSQRPQCTTSST
ncbi:MAG: hypothetical protein O3A28_01425 [Actinomycetota bacterium]|nr:hypothetical protein [Actinomycetota bacterium]MDA3006645.1 hypothetical protein [Actinomycetota bacterium]MDA3033669.1 hypothetical protein [Actinomycetota bacterium]